MTYPAVPLRFIRHVGRHAEATIMWDGQCGDSSAHVARVPYLQGVTFDPGASVPDGWRYAHPEACDRCGSSFEASGEHRHSGSLRIEWDTPSGRPEPGDVYWKEDGEHGCFHWDNCDGRHLMATLPNGHSWDIDSRASNCDRPDDRTHRCWIRTGDPEHPETLDVSKDGNDGNTCTAGAGSIRSGDYHGFLRDGRLTAG